MKSVKRLTSEKTEQEIWRWKLCGEVEEEEDGETGLKDATWRRGEAETKSGGKATSFWGLKAQTWPLSHRHKL